MPETNEDHTRLHQTIERASPEHKSSKEKKHSKGRLVAVGAVALAGVALVAGGIAGVNKIIDTRHQHQKDIAEANAAEINRIIEEQEAAKHIQVMNKMVVLLPGSIVRETMIQSNSSWKIIPGNEVLTVEDGQAVLMARPLSRKEGALWVQATKFVPLEEVPDMPEGSAKTLAEQTVSVNLTGLVEQNKAIVCDLHEAPVDYATISSDFNYVANSGGMVAQYQTVGHSTVEFLENSGVISCSTKQ